MSTSLCWNTVTPLLKKSLQLLMKAPTFHSFRLVGGTALSLQLGHRLSVNIDMFSDADYGTIDFGAIDKYLSDTFNYVETSASDIIGAGKSYIIGNSWNDNIKLDVYHTDPFIFPALKLENVCIASIEEIIAMKVEIISTLP